MKTAKILNRNLRGVTKDLETPLLVGKGFLATANAVIDCRKAKIAVGEGIDRCPNPYYARKEFMKCHLPREYEIARDAEINPFKDVSMFRRMVEFLGALPINLKGNMWELNLMRRSMEVLRKFHMTILGGRFNQTTDQIDDIISAELPFQAQDPKGYKVVTDFMLHGPYGKDAKDASCNIEEKCSKRFPKAFYAEKIIDPDGYPIYRRRDNKASSVKAKFKEGIDVTMFTDWFELKKRDPAARSFTYAEIPKHYV
ncbi:hypothetical protein Tco_1361468 [Tanacetum coccineum]